VADLAGARLESFVQGLARDELHHVEVPALADAGVDDGDDAGVLQARDHVDLAFETFAGGGGVHASVEHELDGDGAAGGLLNALKHHAHAALTDAAADVVSLDFGEFVRCPGHGCLGEVDGLAFEEPSREQPGRGGGDVS